MSSGAPTALPTPRARPISWLLAARGIRDFGDGFAAILLPVYLLELGYDALVVGVVSTSALLGSALLTVGVGTIGGRHDPRSLLIAASALMIATGIGFALAEEYAWILVVAFAGTLNPSVGTVSVFVPLEHAALAREAGDAERTRMFARYSLIGALAAAVGALAAGAPSLTEELGVDRLAIIRAMFVLYAVLGAVGGLLYRRVPARPAARETGAASVLGPSKGIVLRLAALFCLDSFAGGFIVQSLMALWLFQRFGMSLAAASLFFFLASLLSALSFLVAAWLSRRIGLVNTMVFTHLPSHIALMLAAVAPTLPLALGLLLARAALSQMDVPVRSSYVMAVVSAPERAAAASFTTVPRSLAAAVSPSIAGAMFAASLLAMPLLLAGALKIVYDLLLLAQFRHIKPPEER